MSKYLPLANYLRSYEDDSVVMSFQQIENILGETLPESAKNHQAWWANSRTQDSHTWAHLWLEAGWQVSNVNLQDRSVNFIRFEFFSIESKGAREGYEVDRTILSRSRNAAIANNRKELDNYTCQACSFRLQIGARWIIEVHHINPLSNTGETETTIEDLVSLCPTCHRVAHLRREPYPVYEIRRILAESRNHA